MAKRQLHIPKTEADVNGKTIFLVKSPKKGKVTIDWWTNDNLDQGYPSDQATAHYSFRDKETAASFIHGDSSNTKMPTHSWKGLYGNPVWIVVNGKVLPMRSDSEESHLLR